MKVVILLHEPVRHRMSWKAHLGKSGELCRMPLAVSVNIRPAGRGRESPWQAAFIVKLLPGRLCAFSSSA